MASLQLDMFINAYRDYEASRYRVMSGIQRVRQDFSQNRIYPTLAELIELFQTLQRIAQHGDAIRRELPKEIRGIDLEANRIIFDPAHLNRSEFEAIEELINWALPEIREAIEEGKTIFNFVDENLTMAGVGIVPSYVEEGYLLVPDVKSELLHVLRYEVSIFSGVEEKYRNLKTTAVKSVPLSAISTTAGNLKLELIRANRDLPNPATYLFQTELDFPFDETILPVAKRKFMRLVSSQ